MPGMTLITYGQVADLFGVSIVTIRRWAALGTIPAPIKIGHSVRWRKSELDDWLNERPAHETKDPTNVSSLC